RRGEARGRAGGVAPAWGRRSVTDAAAGAASPSESSAAATKSRLAVELASPTDVVRQKRVLQPVGEGMVAAVARRPAEVDRRVHARAPVLGVAEAEYVPELVGRGEDHEVPVAAAAQVRPALREGALITDERLALAF